MDNNLRYILVALLVLLLCRTMTPKKVVVIEPENINEIEDFDTVKIDPLTGNRSEDGVEYTIRGDRYLAAEGSKGECLSDFDQYSPGANNTTSDYSWITRSPGTTLVDNTFTPESYNKNARHNYPLGLPTDLTRNHQNINDSANYKHGPNYTPTSQNITGIEQPKDEVQLLIERINNK